PLIKRRTLLLHLGHLFNGLSDIFWKNSNMSLHDSHL
ncbi:uncharacterized protein METZ01_LOCUS333767, partial [marine metagenome]